MIPLDDKIKQTLGLELLKEPDQYAKRDENGKTYIYEKNSICNYINDFKIVID